MIAVPPDPPAPEHLIEQRLVACGLNPSGFTVSYQDELQSIEVVISEKAGASKDMIDCIREAVRPEIVTFLNSELRGAYYEREYELARPELVAGARKSLQDRGLLATLPQRDDFRSREDFAVALERHCGFKPHSILRVSGDTFTVWPPSEGATPVEGEFEKFSCLLAALTVASDADGNLKIGLVGNEKIRQLEGE